MMDENRYSQVVIIGGTGQIGHRFVESFLSDSNTFQIIATSRKVINEIPTSDLAKTVIQKIEKLKSKSKSTLDWLEFDLDQSNQLIQKSINELKTKLNLNKKTLIIIAAAYTNVDGCEQDPQMCNRINIENTKSVLEFAKSITAKIIFYSTDYVFDGKDGPYSETHQRNAISVYGQSKVSIEEWLEKNTSDSLILRTTGVFDYIPGTKSFVMQMLDLWKQNKITTIPSDQLANPIWAKDIVTATRKLINQNEKGIFGVGGASFHFRSEFAKLISDVFGYGAEFIKSITTKELNQKAKRPLLGGVKIEKLVKTIHWSPKAAKDALIYLRDYEMKEYKEK